MTAADPDDSAGDRPDEGAPGLVVTVLDRLVSAGIGEERARGWITTGGARVDGEVTTDPASPAPPPARVVLHPA